MKKNRIKFLLVGLLLVMAFGVIPANAQGGEFTLVILHNNDGESQLLNAGGDIADFGGVARFATLVNNLRSEAEAAGQGVVLLSSGDNFLVGPELSASLERGAPFLDTIAINMIDYDAMAIGNHEFDLGPDVLADFIEGFGGELPFISANLDFSGEPRLQALVDAGTIVKSTVIEEQDQQIGVVGATTPTLPTISSPRNVGVSSDVAGAIQAEIDALEADGINKIILISHLQGIGEDLDLAGQLSGVDVMIAGGGDELLAGEGDVLVPGDEEPYGSYPLTATGADGAEIPVVTTPGNYKYVGRLGVTFDEAGNVTAVGEDSGLVRVAGGDNPDAVEADPEIVAQVVDPVTAYVDGLAQNVIASSEVALEGRRSPGVRTQETNEGNLMADALLWQANQVADQFGVAPATIALQNGGGIRNDNVIPAGDFTELNTYDIAPFANYVAIVQDVSPEQLKEIMENAVSQVEDVGGRFAQIAGFSLVYDLAGTARVEAEDGTVTPGSRVQSITLDDGTAIVQDGAVVEGAPAVNVATIDFLANGGDQYPYGDAAFTSLGVSYQAALSNYITDALGGVISAAQYPEGGSGRITQVDAMMADAETMAEEDAAMAEEGMMAEGCEEVYVVQADDWLSTIAEKFYGDVTAYAAIFDATNSAAAAGSGYDVIVDVNIIEVGQRLCIPVQDAAMAEDGEAMAAEGEMAEGEMAESEDHSAAPHWGYTGDVGPEFWDDLSAEWALCSTGTSQSPIDISSSAATQEGGIVFDYQPTSLQSVVNNGHTIQVNYDAGSTITLGDTVYNLAQFHFHTPSEHTLDGAPAPIEMHLVHTTADNQLAVIGLMMDAGEANPLLSQIWAEAPAEAGEVSIAGEVNVADILPMSAPYYTYSGSLTTPACSEGVSWFVMSERGTASQEQVDQFTAIIGENARPVQPLNDRTIGE